MRENETRVGEITSLGVGSRQRMREEVKCQNLLLNFQAGQCWDELRGGDQRNNETYRI